MCAVKTDFADVESLTHLVIHALKLVLHVIGDTDP